MPEEAAPSAPATPAEAPASPAKPVVRKRAPRKEAAPGEPPAAPASSSSTSAPAAAGTPAAATTATPPAAKRAAPPAAKKPATPPARAPAPAPKPPTVPDGTVVDATGLVLGRAASLIAKRLLNGERIVVVNAEQSVVTGDRAMVLETYRAHRARGSKRTGPHFPRYPDRIFRRTVRGMLPHLKTRGQEALDRLQVHIGVPAEFSGHPHQSLEGARIRPALRRPLTLAEISRLLGAHV